MTQENRLSLFGRWTAAFLVPARIALVAARRRGQGRPTGRRGTRLALDGCEPGDRLIFVGTRQGTWRVRRAAISVLAAAALVLADQEGASARSLGADPLDAAVAEAAARFSLPADWITAVIRAESGGDTLALSSAGAMGLMQLTPATWRDLRAELGLGDDPFDRRDNILAGAFYLRRLLDRFGAGGFLAAYHAGPGRYQQHLTSGRPLPLETRRYVARLAPLIGAGASVPEQGPASRDWRQAGLFVVVPARDLGAEAASLFVPNSGGGAP